MKFEKETKNSIRYKEPDDVANKPVENRARNTSRSVAGKSRFKSPSR
jgi:hypothetical protein